MGLTRSRPSHEILSGDSADVYFARAESILDKEGLDPLVTMEVFTRQDAVLCGIDEARNLLGHVLAGADPAETMLETLHDGDVDRAEGGRPPDPRPLPPVRPVRDGVPRDPRPVDRLGDRRPDVRRGRGAGPGDQLRGTSHPPRHHRCPRLRGDHRRLRRRIDAGRRPACRPRPDRDDAPFAGPHLRRHRRGGPRVRPARGAGRATDRPRRHVQGRGRGGPARRPRARRPALRRAARYAVRAGPGHRRARPRGPGAAGPGRLRPRQDHRSRAGSTRTASATSRRPAHRSTRTRSARTSAARRRSTSPATSRRSTARRSPSAAGSRAHRLARGSRRSTWRRTGRR